MLKATLLFKPVFECRHFISRFQKNTVNRLLKHLASDDVVWMKMIYVWGALGG